MNPYTVSPLPLDLLQSIANRHKALRKAQAWTQQEMADRSGVSLGSLKRFEQTGQISFASLLQMAHVLGRLVDFEQLLAINPKQEQLEQLFSK